MTPRIASFCKKRDTLCASFYNDSLQSGCVLVVFRKWKLCFWLFSESERLFLSNKEQQSASLHRSTSSNHKLQENENQFLIKLVLDRKVSWSKNLGTFLGKYSWTDSLNLLILLPLCCFISSLLDLWMAVEMEEWANMKLWRTLKILWLSLATPYHSIQARPPYHTL